MDIKPKTCDTRTWKGHLFLDISSTNTDTLAPSLYQCVEISIVEVFCCLSHSRMWSGIICDFRTSLREFLDPVVNCFTGRTLFPLQMLRSWTSSIVSSLSKMSSSLYFKTHRFGDWILPPSSGKTYSTREWSDPTYRNLP
jgi:hypothetical protein